MLSFPDKFLPCDLVTIIAADSISMEVVNIFPKKGIPGADVFYVNNEEKSNLVELLSNTLNPLTRVVIVLTSLPDEREMSIVFDISRFYRERKLLTVVIAGISGSAMKEQICNTEASLINGNDVVMFFDREYICSKAGEKWNAIARDPAIFFEMIAARIFTEILTVKGYISMDYEDYREAIQESGMAAMGIGMAGGHGRSLAATREALGSFLFNEADPGLAHEFFIFFFWGSEEITMDEVTDSFDIIDKTIRPPGGFLEGFGFEPALNDQIMVAVLALDVNGRSTGTRKRNNNENPTITYFTL